jgi:hypothetical protein
VVGRVTCIKSWGKNKKPENKRIKHPSLVVVLANVDDTCQRKDAKERNGNSPGKGRTFSLQITSDQIT